MILDKISTNDPEAAAPLCQAYRFKLWAEFNQFYLQDELAELEVNWTNEEYQNHLALSPGLIAVGTPCDRVVPVEVQILAVEPERNLQQWDHLIECSIDVPSGQLVVFGCCENFATATRISLQSGRYSVLVCYGNQHPGEDHIACSDYYLTMLWRDDTEVFQILKRSIDIPRNVG